ncbi:MAG: twin-arginine translocase TatA/TatE family subunit [Alphaproteobacteria bacterium]|nr:twin-arginine translocase TatA/TatE family subunit [Alphaproteobacteria bacterium]
MSLGMTEIILILIVVLVLFGGKKIPELARGLGKAQAEYKKAKETIENEVSEFKEEIEKAAKAEEKKKTSTKKTTTKKTAAPKTPRRKTAAKKTTSKKSAE